MAKSYTMLVNCNREPLTVNR